MPEDMRGGFERLAGKRVPAAVEAIRLVGNLSSRKHYRYTREEVDAIFIAIGSEVDAARGRFDKGLRMEERRNGSERGQLEGGSEEGPLEEEV